MKRCESPTFFDGKGWRASVKRSWSWEMIFINAFLLKSSFAMWLRAWAPELYFLASNLKAL